MILEANAKDAVRNENTNMVFMGTGGRLSIFRWGYRFLASEKGAAEIKAGPSPELHVANWLDCVRTRKQPNCDVVEGHYSAMACHLLNAAYKTRTRVAWRKEWDV